VTGKKLLGGLIRVGLQGVVLWGGGCRTGGRSKKNQNSGTGTMADKRDEVGAGMDAYNTVWEEMKGRLEMLLRAR